MAKSKSGQIIHRRVNLGRVMGALCKGQGSYNQTTSPNPAKVTCQHCVGRGA